MHTLCKILVLSAMNQAFDEFTLKLVCRSAVHTSCPTVIFYTVV